MNVNYQEVNLRCGDYEENLVFKKVSYPDGDKWYEFAIEDSYCGGNYRGIFGRLKRAWKAFWSEPVVYTSLYCEDDDEKTLKKFLRDCLNIIEQKSKCQ